MYYLAIDIGASSGRHILAEIKNGKMELNEIYRFENGAEKIDGHLYWNIDKLFENILAGIKECGRLGYKPYAIGIDTWGVDYALLDKDEKLIGKIYSYRDSRTEKSMIESEKVISFKDLYNITGIQKATFNTVYQLYDDKMTGKIDKAEYFLTIPDYLNYLLSDVKANEYTIASTTALVNAKTRDWDYDLIDKLGYPRKIFQKIVQPGTILGKMKEEIAKEVGFDAYIIAPACHDTGSAVMGVPSLAEIPLYISSGTWSLLGVELKEPFTIDESREFNMTNEGGFDRTIRYLKNITGMWTIQSIRKELNKKYTYDELMYMAMDSKHIKSLVDLNDQSFMAPDSMIDAVKDYCKKTNQVVPETIGEVMEVVYMSLATLYADTVNKIEQITNKKFTSINIVGGGSKDRYLNQLAGELTKKEVYAGPTEGTAIGNVLAQAIASGEINGIKEGRQMVINSFDVQKI